MSVYLYVFVGTFSCVRKGTDSLVTYHVNIRVQPLVVCPCVRQGLSILYEIISADAKTMFALVESAVSTFHLPIGVFWDRNLALLLLVCPQLCSTKAFNCWVSYSTPPPKKLFTRTIFSGFWAKQQILSFQYYKFIKFSGTFPPKEVPFSGSIRISSCLLCRATISLILKLVGGVPRRTYCSFDLILFWLTTK